MALPAFLIQWTCQRAIYDFGFCFIVGYYGGYWWCARTLAGSETVMDYNDGFKYRVIAAGVERVTGFWGTTFHWLYIDLPLADRNLRYVSKDQGYTWVAVD